MLYLFNQELFVNPDCEHNLVIFGGGGISSRVRTPPKSGLDNTLFTIEFYNYG